MFCNKCGHELTEGSAFCQRCGALVVIVAGTTLETNYHPLNPKKRSKRGGCLVLILLSLVLVGIVSHWPSGSPNSPGSNGTQPGEAQPSAKTIEEPKLSRERALANVEIVKYSWRKEAFDTIMKADFTIRNNNSVPVKDLEITCTHSAESGTVIDHNMRTIYQVIPAHSTKTFRDFNMGFIHSQAARSGCVISDLVVMDSGK